MIKKALTRTLEQLLNLNTALWIQIGGISASISLGVIVYSSHLLRTSGLEQTLGLIAELFIILFSVTTFSIYLSKTAARRADRLGLRKTMGATGWSLFLETSAQTTLIMLIAMVLSVGVIDVGMALAGLSFEALLSSLGALQFGILLLIVFVMSEGVLFIVQGFALAPNIKSEFDITTISEKYWLLKLAKLLVRLSLAFGLLTGLILFIFFTVVSPEAYILYIIFFFILAFWWNINRGIKTGS